jgi:hypothetical protein
VAFFGYCSDSLRCNVATGIAQLSIVAAFQIVLVIVLVLDLYPVRAIILQGGPCEDSQTLELSAELENDWDVVTRYPREKPPSVTAV